MFDERYTVVYNAPRPLYVVANTQKILKISWTPPPPVGLLRQDNAPLLTKAARELREYFDGKRRELHFDIDTDFPPFTKAVYAHIAAIPYGQTRDIAQLADALGHPTSVRAIGTLCHYAPLIIRIPVHRVTGITLPHESRVDEQMAAALREMEKRQSTP